MNTLRFMPTFITFLVLMGLVIYLALKKDQMRIL